MNELINMSVKNFEFRHTLPIDIKTAWSFFSDPENLSKITPPEMNFVIHTNIKGRPAYAGQMIVYTVSPLLNIPMSWVTEITHVQEPNFFVDEQRKGPYKMWHHQHKIEAIEGGVLMTDIVNYQPPFGFLGSIANTMIIKKQLKEIFDYRTIAIEKRFGKMN